MRQHLLFVLALLICFTAPSQDLPTQFTLEEAIQFALENNYSAINASRDMVDAEKQKWETIAKSMETSATRTS